MLHVACTFFTLIFKKPREVLPFTTQISQAICEESYVCSVIEPHVFEWLVCLNQIFVSYLLKY